MYTVLLVDDEKYILQGISTLVQWEQLSTQLIGTALNGEIAYEMIKNHPPDIVISDIKMPGMNGLELIRKVHAAFPRIRFIILSGYEEFEFAKTAMEFGVKHYLLKPCNERVISEELRKVVHEIVEARRSETFLQVTKYNLEKVMPQVKEQFLKEFITNKAYGPKDWDYYSQLFHYKTFENEMRLVLFSLEGGHEFEYIYALKNIAVELFGGEQGIVLGTTIGDCVVTLIEDRPEAELFEILKKIKSVYKEYYHLTVTVAVSGSGGIDKGRRLYKEAMECMTHRFFLGEGSIITHRDVASSDAKQAPVEFDHEALALALRSGNTQHVVPYLKDFFETLKRWTSDIDWVKSYMLELYMVIIRQAGADALQGYFKQTQVLHGLTTLEEIEEFIVRIAEEIARHVYESHTRTQNRIVKRIMKHVHDHIADETLSLSKLANGIMYMNVDYLGRLFKKETGERFTTYLARTRIEHAKQLIEASQEASITEVAERVGFGNNTLYFSRVFKKQTGHSPTDYKKSVFPGGK